MKRKIKWKLVGTVLASTGLASIGMFLISLIMIYASKFYAFAVFFNQHLSEFILLFLLIFVGLFIMFFLMLIRKHILYLEDINKTLNMIDNENLDICVPIKTEDEIGQMAITINQMSDRLKKAKEKERSYEKIKSDLITNMSHDLRTPLTSIIGYLGLIREKSIEEKQVKKYLKTVYDKCMELKTLIDKLFEYSKLQNLNIIINKMRVNLSELIEQTIMGFLPLFDEMGMTYQLDFYEEKLLVDADPTLMSRVFSNLISNAALYGKEGKKLDVTTHKENQYAVIQFINYGSQIPREDLLYIFDRYYKGDNKSGSGLGLAIVKRIIDLHNGEITVESNEKKTVFEVRLDSNK